MSKARDLIGKSGALGPAGASPSPKPASQPRADDQHENDNAPNQGPDALRRGQSSGGVGKAPVGRRPKV